MVCPKCGKENMDNSNYCEACGVELHTEIAEQRIHQQTEQQFNNVPEHNQQPINNYMIFSVLTTIFCCLPFGIVAIIYSSKVSSLISIGNIQGAIEASKKAKMWSIVSLVLGIVSAIIFGIISFTGVLAAMSISGIYGLPY